MFAILAVLLGLADQSQPPTRILNPTSTSPTGSDARMTQFDWPEGATWRVLAVNSNQEGPIVITKVEEVRQQNPPSTWGVYFGNGGLDPIASLTMAAAVVDVNGKVKAIQNVPQVKNLKPQQVVRKEIPIRVTILAPTDRVVFYAREYKSEGGDFKSVDAEVAELIKAAVAKVPVP
jgi:hypothetical protein